MNLTSPSEADIQSEQQFVSAASIVKNFVTPLIPTQKFLFGCRFDQQLFKKNLFGFGRQTIIVN